MPILVNNADDLSPLGPPPGLPAGQLPQLQQDPNNLPQLGMAEETDGPVVDQIPQVLITTISGFGAVMGRTPSIFPNDSIQLNLYNAVNRYLETNFRINNFTLQENRVTIGVEQELNQLGYLSGRYRVEFKFLRNHLGSGDGHRLRVQEISSNGLEVRVVPESVGGIPAADYFAHFANRFFQSPKSETLPNLQLFKDGLTSVRVFDYVQDRFTFPNYPFSIIFKLSTPSADVLRVGDLLWLSQEVSNPLVDTITLSPPKLGNEPITIGAPNWEVLAKQRTSVVTDYKAWDDILTTDSSTSQLLVKSLFSGSAVEGVELNTDFRDFDNFIHFGSAEERLRNFFYKMELIEFYDQRIATLSPSLDVASSSLYVANVLEATTKKQALVGSFDSYERYLYYKSSSYETTGFESFYPTTWPKVSSSLPYVNFSTTSSQAIQWFGGIIESASAFDSENPHALAKTVPIHVTNDSTNEQYSLFVNMIGHYFDLIYAYIKDLTLIHNRDESLFTGFSKDLVYHVAQSLGVDFENGNSMEDLWTYLLGTDQTGSLSSTYQISSEQRTKEIWKRIVNNLPYLLKTKGTERGVRALISCYGIPQTILRVREFGGPEPDFDTRTDFTFERFSYSTTVGYNGGVGADVNQRISAPWTGMTENASAFPETIELRVKMAPSQSKTQTILVAPSLQVSAISGSAIRLVADGTTVDVSSSIYDGTWHHLAITRDGSDTTLYVRKTNYNKVVSVVSASVNSVSTYVGTLYIPSSTVVAAANSWSANIFTGSVQELRYWNTVLQSRILDNHALAPASIQGNDFDIYTGSTSSFYDLAFRIPLGNDTNKIDYSVSSSISSSHPNYTITAFSGIANKIATFTNFSSASSQPNVEIDSLEWPDLGANRSISNKIRIDDTTVAGGNQLFKNTSVERSALDDNPPDSSRLGVYLSPNDEVNQDVAEQFGGLSIDDFIGDPTYYEEVSYPALDGLKREYYKKYRARNNAQAYIRLLANFDASLFKLIKKMVPYRANTQVGLVVESSILDRSKIPSKAPSYEELHWSSSLRIPDVYQPGGFVQDGDGEPFRNMEGYVREGTIDFVDAAYLTPSGLVQDGDGEPFRNIPGYVEEGVLTRSEAEEPGTMSPAFEEVEYDYVIFDETIHGSPTLTGETDQYRRPLNDFTGSSAGFQFGTAFSIINTRESAYGRDLAGFGSQYTFFTYATSGSGSTRSEPFIISSSRYDYSEPLGVVVMDSRRSAVSNNAAPPYDQDIYGGKAFNNWFRATGTSSYVNRLTSSLAILGDPWTSQYGLRIAEISNSAAGLAPTLVMFTSSAQLYGGLGWLKGAGGGATTESYFSIDAFFYDSKVEWTKDLFYQVDLVAVTSWPAAVTSSIKLLYGSTESGLTSSWSGSIPTDTSTRFQSFVTKATGTSLVVSASLKDLDVTAVLYIPSLKVKCLNYRAEVQDFHLHDSTGMVNARYNGCKMTSQDWNVDSPDTIDGGPVVTITLGGGTDLVTRPSQRGTFEVGGVDPQGNIRSSSERLAG